MDFVQSLAALILFICGFIVVLLSFSASRNKEGDPSAPPRSDGHPLRGDDVRWDANRRDGPPPTDDSPYRRLSDSGVRGAGTVLKKTETVLGP